MLITPANMDRFFEQIDFAFSRGYTAATPATFWERLATLMPSGTETNVYPFLAAIPGFRKWIGPRHLNNLALRSYSLKNEDYELTMAVERNKIVDDQFGFYSPLFEMMGAQKAQFPDRQIAATIIAGTTTLGMDGQYFFDTDHPVDADDAAKGTQSNKLVGAQYDLAADPIGAYTRARAAMEGWVREDGQPMGIVPNIILTGPALRPYAMQVAQAGLTTRVIQNVGATENIGVAAITNVTVGEVEPISTTLLPDPDNHRPWYLLATSLPVKPFIRQVRESTGLVALTDPKDPNVFHERKYLYGEHIREAYGYGFPGMAFRMSAS